MIVKDFDDLEGTKREVKDPDGQWVSERKFLEKDGLGYSFHRTTIEPNAELHLWYKNHTELVSIIDGEGTVTDKRTNEVFELKPGVTYLLDDNDPHILKAGDEGCQMVCVFTPPVTGEEVHDKDGSYKLPES